jgi:DNA polymerase elongation subunit (family B)
MIELLKAEGAEPVEIDTDGIYFRPPQGYDEAQEQALVRRVSECLPEGIEVELDGRYRSMFAYKTKNYALLEYDGRIIIRGSSLKSRGIERYLREFMREMITMLLAGDSAAVEQLYARHVARLRSKELDVAWIARTETINESPAAYREKVRLGKRNPSAAFEIALAAQLTYRAGDQISYYVSGSAKNVVAYESCRPVNTYDPKHPNINVAYYIEKLRHLKKRFESFLPQEPTLFDL